MGQGLDQRRVERHRRERPDREAGWFVVRPSGEDRHADREVPEHLAELRAVERRMTAPHRRRWWAGSGGSTSRPKRLLRADMREIRRRIAADPADRAARSERIWARIVASETAPGDVVRRAPGEPDSRPWAEWCRARAIDVFTPEVDGPELRVIPGDVDPATLDVVVVPGLAFTTDGHRLGQGGGHFDRFLIRLGPHCSTIGVCFHEQLVADLPMAEHDVHVALVVTD